MVAKTLNCPRQKQEQKGIQVPAQGRAVVPACYTCTLYAIHYVLYDVC